MKKNSFGAVVFALLVGAAVATGCGGNDTIIVVDPVSSICQDICACTRCTRNDLQACEDDAIAMSGAAAEDGCSAEFEDVVACVSANVTCVQDKAVTAGCDAEQAALDACAAGLEPFEPSACDLASDALDPKYAACGLVPPPATPRAACTDSLASTLDCVATCYEAASCGYLQCDAGNMVACDDVSPEETQAFADCIITCR
jgi:hypothetical protein